MMSRKNRMLQNSRVGETQGRTIIAVVVVVVVVVVTAGKVQRQGMSSG
jgi:hypothetical protein